MLKKRMILFAALFFAFAPASLLAQSGPQPASQAPVADKAAPQSSPRMSAYAPAERIPNLDGLKAELKQYYACTCKCGCYAKDLDRQADRAISYLRMRVAHPRSGEKLALVLDIDETTLSNYDEMANADFAYNKPAFDAWVETAKSFGNSRHFAAIQ